MPAPDFTVLSVALATTKRHLRFTPDAETEAALEDLLEITAGTNNASDTVYRPWYVAAKWLEQNAERIQEAEGVIFDNFWEAIGSLYGMQRSYDAANDLTVPEEWQAGDTTVFAGVAS